MLLPLLLNFVVKQTTSNPCARRLSGVGGMGVCASALHERFSKIRKTNSKFCLHLTKKRVPAFSALHVHFFEPLLLSVVPEPNPETARNTDLQHYQFFGTFRLTGFTVEICAPQRFQDLKETAMSGRAWKHCSTAFFF